ncbi:hypothetical protein [Alsobacter sp. SYSU BS001988]
MFFAGGPFIDLKPIRELNEHLPHLVSHTAAATIREAMRELRSAEFKSDMPRRQR